MSWMSLEGSTTDVAGPERKREWIPEVCAPPELECSGRGWWTMLEWGDANPNAGADAGGGAKVDASYVSIVIVSTRSGPEQRLVV